MRLVDEIKEDVSGIEKRLCNVYDVLRYIKKYGIDTVRVVREPTCLFLESLIRIEYISDDCEKKVIFQTAGYDVDIKEVPTIVKQTENIVIFKFSDKYYSVDKAKETVCETLYEEPAKKKTKKTGTVVSKVKVDEGCYKPVKAHEDDAGFDLKAPFSFRIEPKSSKVIDTGVHFLVPKGYVGMLKSKSGLNVKHGILSEGVIDAGYTGSIVVKLYNQHDTAIDFEKGDKITQLVVIPIPKIDIEFVDDLDEQTERGNNGFGSSGK